MQGPRDELFHAMEPKMEYHDHDEEKVRPTSLQDNVLDASIAQTNKTNAEIDLAGQHQLQRGLKSRHIQCVR